MQYRLFGKTGIDVPILGFGAMRMPMVSPDPNDPEAKPLLDEPAAVRMIRHAIDSGITYVDTAYGYHGGRSEHAVGEALQEGYREKVFLATKFPCGEFKQPGGFERMREVNERFAALSEADRGFLHA